MHYNSYSSQRVAILFCHFSYSIDTFILTFDKFDIFVTTFLLCKNIYKNIGERWGTLFFNYKMIKLISVYIMRIEYAYKEVG